MSWRRVLDLVRFLAGLAHLNPELLDLGLLLGAQDPRYALGIGTFLLQLGIPSVSRSFSAVVLAGLVLLLGVARIR